MSSIPILFVAGLSGTGKSTISQWLAEDLNFLFLEIDLPGASGIDSNDLRHEWNCFSRKRDPEAIASVLNKRIANANCSGAILSFPSDRIFTREEIDMARTVGIHTLILFGPPQLCIDAFLYRERVSGRGFDEKRWHSKNDAAVERYRGDDYADCRFDAFCADGCRWSREQLVPRIAKWLAAEQIVGRERRKRVSHHDWSGDA